MSTTTIPPIVIHDERGDAFLAALCLRSAAAERRSLGARIHAEYPNLSRDFDYEAEVYDRIADSLDPERRALPVG